MVGLDDIRVFFARHQNTDAQYIATCHIMDLCLASDQNPGMRLSRRWWEQPALYILGIMAGHAAAKGEDRIIRGRGRVGYGIMKGRGRYDRITRYILTGFWRIRDIM